MKNRTLPKCLVVLMLFAFTTARYNPVFAQPQSGEWKIQTAFGEMALTVSPEGTSVTKLSVTFSDYTCGGVTQNGTVSKQNSAGWSISGNQFSIATTINPSGTTSITVAGTFSQAGNEASGTWNLNVSGTICSDTWNHTLSNGTIPEGRWKSIGPYMGYINAMAMDNSHPDTVYAATPQGLFRTMDAAENWIKVNLPEIKIDKVVVSQSHSNHVICASEYNVFSSSDYGFNWDVIWTDTVRIECITFNPENPNTILIGTDNRYTTAGFEYGETTAYFFRSTNGGNTWGKMNFNGIDSWHIPQSVKYLVIDPSDTSKIYVGTENSGWGAVFVSHDNGMNWVNAQLTGSREEVYALSCTPKGYEDHTVCVIAAASLAPDIYYRKLFISKDAGMTWEEKIAPSSFDFLDNVNYESTLYISEDYPKYVYIGAEYKYDGGSSPVVAFNLEDGKWYYWPDTPNSFPTSILTCNERDYLGFLNKGVFKYMGNNIWLPKNKGLSSVEILDVAYYPEVPEKLLVAVPGNLQKTNNMGLSWEKLQDTGWNRNSIFVNRNDTSKIIAGTDPDKYLTYGSRFYIYNSENGGESWNSQALFTRYGNIQFDYKMWTGDMNGSPDNSEIVFIGIDGGDASSGAGLYKSSDGGNSWSKKYSTGVSTITVDPKNSNIVYLGTTSLGYVSRSEDWGDNWTRISPGGQNAFVESVWDIEVDNKGQVYAATTSGLFTWEGDTIWTLLPGFPTTKTTAIAIDNTTEEPVYYVGTSGEGVFISSDGGSTWESFNDGLDRKNITKLKISDSYPKYLYAGTSNGGVWVTLLQELGNYNIKEYVSICQGEEYKGWTVCGEYERTLISSMGMDSVITTYLTVNPTYESEEDISICEGEAYFGLAAEGQYIREFKSVNNCDSIVITNLTINTEGICFYKTIEVPSVEYPTIQSAMDAANPGDTVLVADGTYTGDGNLFLTFRGKAITVKSENGPENCIIDCVDGTGVQAFLIKNGETRGSVVEGFKIINGCWVIYVENSSPTITGNILVDNNSGVYCGVNSNPLIENNTILYSNENGIYCYRSNGTIESNSISNSESYGIYCSQSSPFIRENKIEKNKEAGIYCKQSSPEISRNLIYQNGGRTFSSNTRTEYDSHNRPFEIIVGLANEAGISINENSNPKIQNNIIAENKGVKVGAVFSDDSAVPTIINNHIIDNSSIFGGSLNINNASAKIINNIVAGSKSSDTYQGVSRWYKDDLFAKYVYDGALDYVTYYFGFINTGEPGEVHITGCTGLNVSVWAETGERFWVEARSDVSWGDHGGLRAIVDIAGSGGFSVEYRRPDSNFPEITHGCNAIISPVVTSFGTAGEGTAGAGIVVPNIDNIPEIGYNNIYGNPGGNYIFSDSVETKSAQVFDLTGTDGNISSDPLIDGETYELKEGSPCIDAGTPDVAGLGIGTSDYFGNPRIFNGIIDIGAVEFQSSFVEFEEYVSICQGEEYESFTESGTFQRTLTSAAGMDSIVTTHLTVNPTYETEEYVSICEGDNYLGLTEAGEHPREFETVNGCDSTMITHLTVNDVYEVTENIEICEGDSYRDWTVEGSYPVTYTTAFGCDSIVTTNLSFFPSFKPAFTADADTLTSNEIYSAYQWYDAGGAIAGATGQRLVISNSGEYHLEGTNEHGCTYASDAQYVIQTYSAVYSSGEFEFSVIPNPNRGIFLFRIDANPPENLSVKLMNGLGQVIETRIITNPSVNQTEPFHVTHLSAGVYHLVVISDKLRDNRKIVIQ